MPVIWCMQSCVKEGLTTVNVYDLIQKYPQPIQSFIGMITLDGVVEIYRKKGISNRC